MKTRIFKTTLVLSSILLLQACSAQQLANLNSCTDPTAWGCGGGSRAVNDMSEREARYRAELAEWESCKMQESAGYNVYCGVRPTPPT